MFEWLFPKKGFKYKCSECGDVHHGSPSFSFKYPTYFFDVPEDRRSSRVQISEDLCKVFPDPDEADNAPIYCIRAILEVPIKGTTTPFTWGIWVSQSQENFEKYVKSFQSDQSTEVSFGWLPVDLPYYNTTPIGEPLVHLECEVQWGAKGQRPKVLLWENTHQIAVDQKNGISWKNALKIARQANDGSACTN
jgi:hypothetical protein